MKGTVIVIMVICTSIFRCDQKSTKSALCPAPKDELIFMVNPRIEQGGGMFAFNDSFFIDFKEIEVSSLDRDRRIFNILRDGPTILKDSNSFKVMVFNDLDTVVIREGEMFSEKAILVECERIKSRKSKKNERNN